MTTDEARLAQIQARCDRIIESLTLSNSREEVMPYLTAGAFPLDDLCFLLAETAALRDQLARAEAVVQAAREWRDWHLEEAGRPEEDNRGWVRLENALFVALADYDAAPAARTPTPGAAGEVG